MRSIDGCEKYRGAYTIELKTRDGIFENLMIDNNTKDGATALTKYEVCSEGVDTRRMKNQV